MSDGGRLGPNYWKLWVGSVVSNFGDGISFVAYPWLASVVTRDPVLVALVGVATRLPWLVFTLPAGVITDRVDRRRLVAAMDLVRFVVTLGVAAAVLIESDALVPIDSDTATDPARLVSSPLLLAVLYLSGILLGCAEVLRDNGAQTLMPSVVEQSQLERANGRLWGAEMVMNQFLGPVAAGALLAVSFTLPFVVDSATFAVAAALTVSMTGRFTADRSGDGPADTERQRPGRWRREIAEGFGWLWHHPFLRHLAVSLGVLNMLGSMTVATQVLFAQEVLALGATGFAVLLWAGALGGIIGSVGAEAVSTRIGQGRSLFATIAAGVVTSAVIGLTSIPAVVFAMFVVFSFTAVLWNVITVSLRQTIIPDRLLGRVNSVYRLFGWGMMPIGAVAGGAVVTIAEAATGDRLLALRLPFLVAAAAHLLLLAYALPRLGQRHIDAALAGTGGEVTPPDS